MVYKKEGNHLLCHPVRELCHRENQLRRQSDASADDQLLGYSIGAIPLGQRFLRNDAVGQTRSARREV